MDHTVEERYTSHIAVRIVPGLRSPIGFGANPRFQKSMKLQNQ